MFLKLRRDTSNLPNCGVVNCPLLYWSMKTLALALGMLFGSMVANAQKAPAAGVESAAPFKGANALIVHTRDSASVAYNNLAQSLLASGYSLEKTDKALGFIATTSRPAPRYNMMYACRFFIKPNKNGSDIQATGVFTLPGAAAVSAAMAGEDAIEYRGGPASTFMICWQAMQKAATAAYPAVAPSYLRLP